MEPSDMVVDIIIQPVISFHIIDSSGSRCYVGSYVRC